MEEDDRDDRTKRDPYTIQQGLELFALPIWTGCASLNDRLQPGVEVWHDAMLWVLIVVWYSGTRREEACKLLVDDVRQQEGIWFFDIRRTRAGGVKTATSVRQFPVCNELIRIGFIDFVIAMKLFGEEYLFREILPGRGGRALGDVFHKQVWMKIKPCLAPLQPGQAVHSGRPMVSTELKMLRVFEEFRADLLEQRTGGENGGRYASASRLAVLLEIVQQIPIVTAHLPSKPGINLLPASSRCTRPVRESEGRRGRS